LIDKAIEVILAAVAAEKIVINVNDNEYYAMAVLLYCKYNGTGTT